jgi:hypothetical protein
MSSNRDHSVCRATCRDGEPCTTPALPNDAYRFAHSPTLREKRIEARRRGGEHRATAHRLQRRMTPRLTRVVELLESALDDAYSGALAPRQCEAVAAVARALIAAIELGELEVRLTTLEEREAQRVQA